MNKNMRTVCKEIKQGKNLESNLPNYFNRLVTLYEEYATLNLTMNYYTYYENYMEATSVKSKEEKNLLEEVNLLIKEYLLGDYSATKAKEGVEKIDKIRSEVMKHMQLLTTYTDIFLVYEYVLERMQYRFEESDMDIDEEAFAMEVFQYIFSVQDNMLINDNIKTLIGELPIRMTKNKYFDIVKDSISIYKNGDRSSLDNYVYILETASTIYEADGMNVLYQDLAGIKKEFEQLDYSNMNQEQFNLYVEKLKTVTLFITDKVDFYYGLQEVINFLYTSLLLTPYGYMEGGYKLENMTGSMQYLLLPVGQEDNVCRNIISEINKEFLGEGKELLESEENLTKLEGIQEKVWDEILFIEATLDDIGATHEKKVEELLLLPLYHSLKTAQNLINNSIFIDLNKKEQEGIADDEYVKQVQDKLIEKLTVLFSNSNRLVIRGIMACTLNKMPVFFNSSEEILNYIKSAMEQCNDRAEKISSVEIIKDIFGL